VGLGVRRNIDSGFPNLGTGSLTALIGSARYIASVRPNRFAPIAPMVLASGARTLAFLLPVSWLDYDLNGLRGLTLGLMIDVRPKKGPSLPRAAATWSQATRGILCSPGFQSDGFP